MHSHMRWLELAVAFCMLPQVGCAQQPAHACKQVAINSAGVYCFDSDRLLGIAPGSAGLGSTANYVRISPPATAAENYDDVSKIVLMADIRPSTEPRCQASENTGNLSCSMSVAGRMLNVIVTFRSAELGRFEERTKIVAADVAENVVKEWRKE